ncbi:hypothetical protein [Paenibacillus aquistagni]|uniref:hypothetical protein n=1 Tax=Paenibacillus aquistagni TaxID=1852522 RepID=UPI00145A38DF|nr:hypothetical protein [Paenibacillus aquistagni]NMM50965.1 hypothetical protein [Paenibacillus aquistagni]
MSELLIASEETDSDLDSPSLVLGNFNAEAFWRPADLAQLPSLPSRYEHSVAGAMDELLFILCQGKGAVLTALSMNKTQHRYLHELGFDFMNLSVQEHLSQNKSADLDLFHTLAEPSSAALCEPLLARLPLLPYAILPSTDAFAAQYGAAEKLPHSSIVAKVNSKIYSHDLAKELGGFAPGEAVYSAQTLLEAGAHYLQGQDRIVIKDPYGVSGKGNLVVDSIQMLNRIAQYVERQQHSGKHVQFLIEPWLCKANDFSCQLYVDDIGMISIDSIQFMDNRGQNYGGSYEAEPVMTAMLEQNGYLDTMKEVARALYKEGYYGPICVDSMLLEDQTLVPIVEINARHSMGCLNDRLNRRLKQYGQQAMLLSLELRIPEWGKEENAYERLLEQLHASGLLFGTASEDGILPLSANTLLDPRGIHSQGRWYVAIVTSSPLERERWRQKLLAQLASIGFVSHI